MNDEGDIEVMTGVESIDQVEAVEEVEGIKGNANGLKFGGAGRDRSDEAVVGVGKV